MKGLGDAPALRPDGGQRPWVFAAIGQSESDLNFSQHQSVSGSLRSNLSLILIPLKERAIFPVAFRDANTDDISPSSLVVWWSNIR